MNTAIPIIFTTILITQVFSETVPPKIPDSCITPNGEIAYCISIYQCELFMNALRNLTQETNKTFLQQSQCAYYSNFPFVCCGSSAEYELSEESGLEDRYTTNIEDKFPEPLNVDLINKYELSSSKRDCSTRYVPVIENGNKAQITQYPWTALLEYNKNGISECHCGGTLISERYVLTAAHCLTGNHKTNFGEVPKEDDYRVRLGENDRSKEKDCDSDFCDQNKAEDFYIEKLTIHPLFNVSEPTLNDIALIKLKKDVTFNGVIGPACLPVINNPNLYGTDLEVAGWAISGNCTSSAEKLRGKIQLSKNKACSFNFNLVQSQLCAGKNKDNSSRIGDSGGGLIAQGTILEGIDSLRMEDCPGDDSVPILYTRVYSFMPWILENLAL